MTLFPSASLWAKGPRVNELLDQSAESAFHFIDVEHDSLDEAAAQHARNLGLKVSCVALHHRLPPGCSLDGKARSDLSNVISHFKHALERSAELGARAAYLGPCSHKKNLGAFTAAVTELAQFAGGKGIRLCIEHVPGSALSSAIETLEFIDGLKLESLYLLLDVGHATLSKEKPWEIIESAGPRLGYVQMDDNDGKVDRHWPLLDGKIKLADLKRTMEALMKVGYDGTLGLELNADMAGLMSGLSKNRNLLLRLQLPAQQKSFLEPEARRK